MCGDLRNHNNFSYESINLAAYREVRWYNRLQDKKHYALPASPPHPYLLFIEKRNKNYIHKKFVRNSYQNLNIRSRILLNFLQMRTDQKKK